jgi:tetratricopeptide (TPR) repeat protein
MIHARFASALLLVPSLAAASPESAALRARAFQHAYSLDYDLATRDMQAAVKADPQDVAAERGLAVIPWLLISFRRGAVTVDDYLGSISKQNVALREPPQDLAASFKQHVDRALVLAEAAVNARPRDAEAHYQLGSVVGLQASYVATVEGRVLGGFRAARRAYDAHEQVLDLDTRRKDAGLIVGMYRYIVSALSLPLRMLAYVVGFGGGKELGVRMIEEAAAYPGDSQAEARFALVLIYNRDARYDEAQRVLTQLQREYPRNRILWLEAGSTALRAGRAREAHELLTKGLHMLAADKRPRMFGEEALWLLKRGTTRVALAQTQPAEEDLRRTLTLESRKWVTGRAHTELGKLADLRNDRVRAQSEYRQAVALAEQDNDPLGAEQARRWLDTPYRGGVR